MKGSRRALDVECMLCGAAPGKPCVKGHVSPLYGSSKAPRKPHVVYPGQQPKCPSYPLTCKLHPRRPQAARTEHGAPGPSTPPG